MKNNKTISMAIMLCIALCMINKTYSTSTLDFYSSVAQNFYQNSLKKALNKTGSYIYDQSIKTILDHPYISAAALHSTGLGNRLANLAGWRYSNMSDYPEANPGSYCIDITINGDLNYDKVNRNPLIKLLFKKHELKKDQIECYIFKTTDANDKLKNEFNPDNIYATESPELLSIEKIFEILLNYLKDNALKNEGNISITINVGIEDLSGVGFHIFNRRWLTPIQLSLPINLLKDKEKTRNLITALFLGQLKNKISSKYMPIPYINQTLDNLEKSDKKFLKKYYYTNIPYIHILNKNMGIIDDGIWRYTEKPNIIFDSIKNYNNDIFHAKITFEPKTPTYTENGIVLPLAPSIFYIKNIEKKDISLDQMNEILSL